MTVLGKETATDIALAHREIETAEKLLEEIKVAWAARKEPDLRDVFSRPHHGLELGVPAGDMSKRLFNVPYSLAIPVIEAHIAQHRARLAALTEKARLEISAPEAGT